MKTPLSKNFLRMSLCLMGLTFSCLSVCATTEFTIGDLTYTVADETSCFVSDCQSKATYVTVPSEVIYEGTAYSVTSIGERAFSSCSRLVSVTIPNSVTSIGERAFQGCSSLPGVTIPNSVTSIGEYAFDQCSGLLSVTIPNAVTSIEKRSFYGCSSLTSVTIPSSVTSIGELAFAYCSSLASVTIPNSVASIGESAFRGCSSLASVTIPNSVTVIGKEAFKDTDIAKTIWLTNTPPSGYNDVGAEINYVANDSYSFISGKTLTYPYLISLFEVDGVKYVPVSPSERTCDAIDCAYDETAINVNIGKAVSYKGIEMKVQDIRPYCFHNNKFVKNAKIDNDVCNIGESTFYGCENLQEILIPNSVKSIEACAFYDCSSLATVTIGTGVTAIGDDAFGDCSSLASIVIPQNVTEIGNSVFRGCSSLADVNIADRDTELTLGKSVFASASLKNVYIGGNIAYPTSSSDGYSPFFGNTTLQTVTITDKETEITEKEFYGCTGLKEVSIGDGVEKIGNYAFSGCSALEIFSFGTSLKSIGDEAFSDCTALTKLTANAQVPPTCGNQALDDIDKWCKIYVPEGQIDAYKAASQWKEFFFIETGVEGVAVDNDATEVARYNLNGARLTAPQRGINVVRMSDGSTKKVLVK